MQAYPTHDGNEGTDPRERILTGGMTLRDWFAGQALIALPHIGCGVDLDQNDTALAAYQIADAMMAAREPTP